MHIWTSNLTLHFTRIFHPVISSTLGNESRRVCGFDATVFLRRSVKGQREKKSHRWVKVSCAYLLIVDERWPNDLDFNSSEITV